MMRAILAACCLVGLVLGGALAPAAGIQTPIPDLGVEGEGVDDGDGGFGDGEGSGAGTDAGLGANESSGVASYGGVSAGDYPEEATVGGRLELRDREELVVESPEPSRWRLGAYATYTGDGWERSESREPLSSPVSAVGADQPAYEIDVEARRSFRSLATVSRPAFGTANDRQVFVDEETAFIVDEPVRAGDTYTTLTYGPVSPASAAVASDGEYPDDIEARYTQLPEDTPDRLGNRTAEITADAETPYEAAVAVEDWLESTKDYSLDASHERGNDVATEFVFEMEAGYCQYFATSMVAMLRTQGIPARYVTGYGPGERVGEETYRVTGANAHAWVEVYIADVGWVTFDPTPAGGRAEAGRDPAPIDELDEDWSASTDDNTSDTLTMDDPAGSSISVTLTGDPVPGRTTTAVVTRNGTPVTNADVLFEGERVGETNRGGAVTGVVPYVETLSVEVRLTEGLQGFTRSGNGSASTWAYSAGTETDGNAIIEFPLPTTIDIDVLGDPEPGDPADVVATLDGMPVPAANVSVDGERVATTDDRGSATVELPDSRSADVVVERGGARGERTVTLRSNESTDDDGPLSVSVTPNGPAPLPYTEATVRVVYENEPVANATVTVDGDSVAETGADGTAVVRLPLSDPVTVTAAAPEGYVADSGTDPLGETASAELGGARLTGTARIRGLYRNTSIVLGVGIGLAGGLVGLGRRRDIHARRLLSDRDRLLTQAAQSVLGGVVGIGAAVDSTLPELRRRLENALALLSEGPEGIATLGAAIVGAVGRGLRRLDPRRLLAAVRGDNTGDAATGASAHRPTVREAWDELRTHASVPSWRTSTPGQIARWAIEHDGLPEDAVATVLAAFREVEYGDRSPESRAKAVEEAIERIREATTDDGGTDS